MTDESISPEFQARLEKARENVGLARSSPHKSTLAVALKELGNIQRRPPQLREDADRTFAESAQLFLEIGMPLEAAWALRHIGINQEYAERLEDAERYYDESLALFRQYADEGDNNYANTVRYPAVIKNRLGKRHESKALWTEAVRRYELIDEQAGVAEGAAWLAIFEIEGSDLRSARSWLERAESAAQSIKDRDTDKFVTEVREKLNLAESDEKIV